MTLLRKRRQELGLTIVQMAKKLGISENTYSKYDFGARKVPKKILLKVLELANNKEDKKIIEALKELEGIK